MTKTEIRLIDDKWTLVKYDSILLRWVPVVFNGIKFQFDTKEELFTAMTRGLQ